MELRREKRISSLELLRIICMLLIVAHHFSVHSDYGSDISGFNNFIIYVLFSGGKVGVNVFVLISGYFLVQSKFKVRRIINVIIPTAIYSVLGYLFVACIKGTGVTFGSFVYELFAIRNDSYWFVTSFVALSILSPFINKLICALNKKQHIILILILIFMQATFASFGSYFSISSIGWFITLYIISGYIRKYPSKILDSKLYTGLAVLCFGLVVALWSAATSMDDIFCLILSVALLCFFKNINIKHSKLINLIAKTTFGIYLIHDNRFIRPVLWNDILLCPEHAYFKSFVLFAIVSIVLVFALCALIDLLRILLTALVLKIYKTIKEKHKAKKIIFKS